MFATSSRARQQAQQESPPPDGADSFYGVRSLNSSVEWGGGEPVRARTLSDNMKEKIRVFEGRAASTRSTTGPGSPAMGDIDAASLSLHTNHPDKADDDATVGSTVDPEAAPSPSPSPDAELQPQSFGSDKTLASLPHTTQTVRPGLLPSLDLRSADEAEAGAGPGAGSLDPLSAVPHLDAYAGADTMSEPSSPASFTSLPSYGASISSMSRTSSPVAGLPDYRQHLAAQEGSDELVLPRLSLPNTSLHMSLRRWEGRVQAVRIALLGGRDKIRDVLRELEEKEELVEVGKNEVGIVRDGTVMAVLVSYTTVEQIKERVLRSYSTLDKILHPSPDQVARDEAATIVRSWSSNNDWLHAAYILHGTEPEARRLSGLIPLCASESVEGVDLLSLSSVTESGRSPTSSRHGEADPTPMLMAESQSYFERDNAQPTGSSVTPDCDALRAVLMNLGAIQSASTVSFLDWRPPLPLESSVSSLAASHESASTMESGSAPMPLVARAQGGGEWEASLSRRVAKRRESGTATYRSKGRRRSPTLSRINSTGEKDCGPDLFPKANGGSKPSRPSLFEMAAETFGPFFGAIKGTAWVWRRTLVSCAVVLAVGTLGYGVWRSPNFRASVSIMVRS